MNYALVLSFSALLPEASIIFWKAIGRSYPEFKQAIISQHEKEKKE